MFDLYRILSILKVETDIIANISVSPKGRAGIYVIMSLKAFRTDIIVFIGDVIMCFMSDLHKATNWPNMFVRRGQRSDSDFNSGKYQRENVPFADKIKYGWYIKNQIRQFYYYCLSKQDTYLTYMTVLQ